jgi:hypothetical protein
MFVPRQAPFATTDFADPQLHCSDESVFASRDALPYDLLKQFVSHQNPAE